MPEEEFEDPYADLDDDEEDDDGEIAADAEEYVDEMSKAYQETAGDKLRRRIEQESRRLEKLRERGLALTKQELEEKADLEQRLPLLQMELEAQERAVPFAGVPDEVLDGRLVESYGTVREAQEERKAAKAALDAVQDRQGSLEHRMAERRARDAQVRAAEVEAQAVSIEYELGRRAHMEEHGADVPYFDPVLSREYDLKHNYLSSLTWKPQPQTEDKGKGGNDGNEGEGEGQRAGDGDAAAESA
jgi:hypothetical protein